MANWYSSLVAWGFRLGIKKCSALSGQRLSHDRLPQGEDERKQVRADGWTLLLALDACCTADWVKTRPAVMRLRCIWEQQFEPVEQGGQGRTEPIVIANGEITHGST